MDWDTIVVGAGSAGCVLAGRLAEDGARRVLVVEAGDSAEANPETLAADQYKYAFINERLMYDRYTVPQPGCADHRMFAGTGRGVGGSGAINAMVYTRGSAFDWGQWGVGGWGWDEVVPEFEKLESQLRVHRMPATRFCEASIAAAEAAGFRRKEDLNDGKLSGFLGYEWMNIDGNERRSGYVSFLRPQLPKANLTLRSGTLVRRVIFEGQRAVGVELEEAGRITVERGRQIVLSAGALETPKLLKISGIGPGAELMRHGIPVIADVPAVGENLHDHPNVQVFFLGKQPSDSHWAQLYGFHRAHPGSSLPSGEADSCYVFYSARTSFREGMLKLVPGMFLPRSIYELGWPPRLLRGAIKAAFSVGALQRFVERMYGIVVILGKPKSRGTVTLSSPLASASPLVDPNYFGDGEDLEVMVKSVRLARKVAAAQPLVDWGNSELMPGARVDSDDAIANFIRKNAMTTYHYAGTCKMTTKGDGRDAVVDAKLRVRGVEGLWVADASVIPVTPVSAMNAPSMLVGWRAADLLR